MMVNCYRCGTPVPEDEERCVRCGAERFVCRRLISNEEIFERGAEETVFVIEDLETGEFFESKGVVVRFRSRKEAEARLFSIKGWKERSWFIRRVE